MQQFHATFDRLRPAAPLVLRLALGIVFVWHGYDKFDTGISMVEGAFDGWGVPAPALTAPLTAVIEIVAGAALLVGVATRFAAAALALVMVGSLVFVKLEMGLPEADPDLALLAGSVALMALGAGSLSVDHVLGIDRSTADPVDARVAATV